VPVIKPVPNTQKQNTKQIKHKKCGKNQHGGITEEALNSKKNVS